MAGKHSKDGRPALRTVKHKQANKTKGVPRLRERVYGRAVAWLPKNHELVDKLDSENAKKRSKVYHKTIDLLNFYAQNGHAPLVDYKLAREHKDGI